MAVLSLLVLAIGVGLNRSDPHRAPDSEGPLFWGLADSMGAGVRIGKPFTYGHVTVFTSGTHAAVLDDVRLWRPTPGLRLLAKRADLPSRDAPHGTLTRAPWYPPRGIRLHPLRGFVVPTNGYVDGTVRPERGVNIVLGLEIAQPGRFSFHGIVVRYHVGDQHYELVVHQALQVCSRAHPLSQGCPDLPLSDVV